MTNRLISKKLFLGISSRRLILPPNSLRAAPFGAASRLSLRLPKNQEVQFGALCLKMREPFLNGKPAMFLIVSKISETEQATPPCRRFAAATPQQILLLP